MKRQKMEYRVGVGAPVILMILVVVSLAVLSLLGWISARFDCQYSQRSIALTVAYYDAAEQAQLRLMELDQQLIQALESSEDAEAYDRQLKALGMDETRIVSWELDAQNDRSLIVEVRLAEYEQAGEGRYALTGHWLRDDYEWSDSDEMGQLFGS
ncbi:MAG: hypothetical protein Q4E13_03505 [Clostridia bacterium]|nr:hypothetical protein [Clostridia bacterium]